MRDSFDNIPKKRRTHSESISESTRTQKITKARGTVEKKRYNNFKRVVSGIAVVSVLAFGFQACNNLNNKSIEKMAQNLDKKHTAELQMYMNKNSQFKKYIESNKATLSKHTDSILKAIKTKDPLSKEKIETQIDLIVESTFKNYGDKMPSEIHAIITTEILNMYQDALDGKIYLYYDHKNDDKEPHIAGLKYSDEIRELMNKK